MIAQRNIVLEWLQNGQQVSSRDAVLTYGIQDLPKRISELRRMGYPIESRRVIGKNRYGKNTHWCVYWMASDV